MLFRIIDVSGVFVTSCHVIVHSLSVIKPRSRGLNDDLIGMFSIEVREVRSSKSRGCLSGSITESISDPPSGTPLPPKRKVVH
jgi:hypothetical protein